MSRETKTPAYSKEFYGWLYDSLKRSSFFDNDKLLSILTLGYRKKLIAACLREVEKGDKALQIGVTFGSQIEKTAEKIGFYGRYDIMDTNKTQLSRVTVKYEEAYPFIKYVHHDAAEAFDGKYDVVICFMMLHELPPMSKTKIINNALEATAKRGKVVFIDYNDPVKRHPFRYFVRMFNRLFQPFAEKMWDREIHSYATNKSDFSWRKTAYFGRMYQKVVATRKNIEN